jgi:NADH dehydrogenase
VLGVNDNHGTDMKRILVIGAGFAGLGSAVGAARERDRLGISGDEVEILVLNHDPYHSIRVRNYEADLSRVRIPLADVLDPIDVKWQKAEAESVDLETHRVHASSPDGELWFDYDRLVLAAGAPLARPSLPGLAEHAFSVDTTVDALRLQSHLRQHQSRVHDENQFTVLVVGAGLVGIEIACELPGMLRASGAPPEAIRIILADSADHVGSTMGPYARPVIENALRELGIEGRTGVSIVSIDSGGADLASGERIPAPTIVWCGGMRASALAESFPVKRDRFGRLPVDKFMKVCGVDDVFAAGDIASVMVDDVHTSVMSCQHARPMGRFSGHNVVCDLLGEMPLAMRIEWYVTVLDLGRWGALYTEGWDRRVVATGEDAKRTKREINRRRIVPPRNCDRTTILDAAAPIVQAPPAKYLDHTH